MNKIPRTITIVSAILVASCVTLPTFPPSPAAKAKGYEGPTLPESEVATVFILDGRPDFESGYICKINEKPATQKNGCASIVYLKPGLHLLSIRYQSRIEIGEGEIRIQVEAGKLYQLNATSFRTKNRGMISLLPMSPSAKLTYRNVAPGLFPGGKAEETIPYGE